MNISRLPIKILAGLLLLGWIFFWPSSNVLAQSGGVEYQQVEVTIGDTLLYDFFSAGPYLPQIEQYGVYPKHGTADLPGPNALGKKGWNTLTYIPNVSNPVIDTIYITYWKFENNNYFSVNLTLEVFVVPSIIHAVDDYDETVEGQAVTIDVLFNDYGDGNVLKVAEIPLVNNGTASLNADSTMVTFTPAPGFSGIGHFNYTICDENGTCDMATVSIGVIGDVIPVFDTLNLTTAKETPRAILINLDGFSVISGPSNGTLDSLSMDYMIYTPDPGFVDDFDEIIFSKTNNNQSHQVLVSIHVLDIEPENTFVFDDYAHTTPGESVEIDVLQNDIGGDELNYIAMTQAPQNGSVSYLGNGMFEYTPNGGFVDSVDHFEYRAFSPNGAQVEYGDVHIAVSDYQPAQGTFELSTPKNVPLVIAYNIPVYGYNFTITAEPDSGSVQFYAGYQTLTINGQTFEGYNMLIYTPDTDVANFIDEFQIEYCVTGSNCPTANVKVDVEILDIEVTSDQFCLGENCVWAGDTNQDGIVDMRDILPLGLGMGEVGVPRPNPDLINWFGQYGDDWNDIFNPAPMDLKHIDTDGNGIIGGFDTVAISQFYLNQHSLFPVEVDGVSDVPLYFYETERTPVTGGEYVEMDIWLGDPNDVIAEDLYGFTFSLGYDQELVDPATVFIDFKNESWVNYNSPVLHLVKKPADGRIDAGLTRTNGLPDDGYGIVASMGFVVIEDVEGLRLRDDHIDLRIEDAFMMNGAGETVAIPGDAIRIPIGKETDEETDVSIDDLKVFPNPANGYVNIYLQAKGKEIERLDVYTMTGQLLHSNTAVAGKLTSLQVGDWQNGVYLVQVVTTDGDLLTQKLQVVR